MGDIMKLSLSHESVTAVEADLLVVVVLGQDYAKHPVIRSLDTALGGELLRIAKVEDFTGKRGTSLTLHTFGKISAKKLRLHALGGKEITDNECRLAGVAAARAGKDLKVVALWSPTAEPAHLRALGEGVLLGAYRYAEYLTGSRKPKA